MLWKSFYDQPEIIQVPPQFGYWWTYHLLFYTFLWQELIKITQPVILGYLIDYFSPTPDVPTEPWQAYLYAAGVSGLALLLATVHGPYFFAIQHMGMKTRVGLCTLVYRKVCCTKRLEKTWKHSHLSAKTLCVLFTLVFWVKSSILWQEVGLTLIECKLLFIVIHTLHVHYAHAAANLNSGYSKYAKVARVHLYNCTPNISRSADASVSIP